MENFLNFLQLNLNHSNSDILVKGVREGVFEFSILNQLLDMPLDPILRARVLYVRNICMSIPTVFEIPLEIQPIERALMLASMDLFELAIQTLNTNFTCKVIGADAKTRTGATINTGVLECSNTENTTLYDFSFDSLDYPDFKVQKLTHLELLYLYIKMKEILKTEDNETLKKFQLKSYLNRALWPGNEPNLSLKIAFLLIDAEINNSTDELLKIIEGNKQFSIDYDFFNAPISFRFDINIQLALAFKNKFFYQEAYDLLLPYPLYLEKIDCLIALRKSQEASDEIYKMISRIQNSSEREEKMILSNMYVKLAHLYQNPSFFDLAVQAFRHSKPYHLKGLFYFNKKQFDLAVAAFEQALQISPVCERIRFSYACALIETDKLVEAEQILKLLKLENPTDENISKNLSYCYYKLNDIEKTLVSLKSIALSDPNSMSQYFILSVKNSKLDNVKWAFGNMRSIDLIKSGIAYYSTNNELNIEELKSIVAQNRYVDRKSYEEVFIGF